MFNGSSCGPDSCEQNGISINITHRTSNTINTTLEIMTGELDLVIMEEKQYAIQCIVEQNLASLSLRGDNINITITLTVYPQQSTRSDIGECL